MATDTRDLAVRSEQRDIASIDLTAIERVIVAGDLSKLSPEERWDYYQGVCRSIGLNPFTQPFAYLKLSSGLTLYALKGAAEQLRRRYAISIAPPSVQIEDGLAVVTVTATDRTGRTDSDLGLVSIDGLRGEARANAVMKAITKAKRRVTLSMCGLGMLDETEVDTIPGARVVTVEEAHGQPQPSAKRQQMEAKYRAGLAAVRELGADVQEIDPATLDDEMLRDWLAHLGEMVKALREQPKPEAEPLEATA